MRWDTKITGRNSRGGVERAVSAFMEKDQKSLAQALPASVVNRTAAIYTCSEAFLECGGGSTAATQTSLAKQKCVSRNQNSQQEAQFQRQSSSKRPAQQYHSPEDSSTGGFRSLGENFILTAKSYSSEELEKEADAALIQHTQHAKTARQEPSQHLQSSLKSKVETIPKATNRWVMVLLTGQPLRATKLEQIDHTKC